MTHQGYTCKLSLLFPERTSATLFHDCLILVLQEFVDTPFSHRPTGTQKATVLFLATNSFSPRPVSESKGLKPQGSVSPTPTPPANLSSGVFKPAPQAKGKALEGTLPRHREPTESKTTEPDPSSFPPPEKGTPTSAEDSHNATFMSKPRPGEGACDCQPGKRWREERPEPLSGLDITSLCESGGSSTKQGCQGGKLDRTGGRSRRVRHGSDSGSILSQDPTSSRCPPQITGAFYPQIDNRHHQY